MHTGKIYLYIVYYVLILPIWR